jgi:hypothetical protein
LDWVTSWDISDVMLLMVRGSGDYANSIICCYLAAGRDPVYLEGMHVHHPLQLLAMSGTHTRPITLDAVQIPDTNVAKVMDFQQWMDASAKSAADVRPATFGVIRGALAELHTTGERRKDAQMRELAMNLADRTTRLRREAYAAMDDDASVETRVVLRAQALRLAVDATTAVITARAGASMRSGCSAERRLREAMFLQVQAQTALTRSASLSLLEGPDNP